MVTDNVSRIDAEIAESLIASWIRKVTGSQPTGTPDGAFGASADVVAATDLACLTSPVAFSMGAEFGARVAIAALANPLNAERDVRDVIAHTRVEVETDAQRVRDEREIFAARGMGAV
ncbi:MAG: hypothetical protein ACYDCA_06590 [Candidatus Tyrphobacter sp.]